ncbi:MAG: YjbQ family protein [Elusimicrobia bacterium]|nr:YjbQ family protein [Elusimicrobiota bacterium]MBD3411648.1 YjbQ family protein [Elusimicrobiota bacterium]
MRISLKTTKKNEFIDITAQVQNAVQQVPSGIAYVFCPHTTAGITINENADPDVVSDIIRGLDRMVPSHAPYDHAEGNSPAHIKASLMGFHQIIGIENSRLVLGTWQGIYFCEFDGPRMRTYTITISPV